MKKILISILIISFIIAIFTNVYAATGRISLGTDSDIVEKGQNFTVTIAGIADNNIIAMQTNLEYDSSRIRIEERVVGEGFIDASGENEIAIMAASNDTLAKSGTLYKITFKVLETAVDGEIKIDFNGAALGLINENSEDEVVNVGDQSVSITIKQEDIVVGGNQEGTSEGTQTPGNTQTPEDNEDGNKDSNHSSDTDNSGDNDSNSGNENKYTNPNKNVSSNKNTNKNTTKLPQTGAESASIVALIGLGAILIISYVSYRKYKNI